MANSKANTKASAKKAAMQNQPSAAARRQELSADVEAFLAKGKEIEQVPTGVTGQDPFGRSKQLVLNSGKKR